MNAERFRADLKEFCGPAEFRRFVEEIHSGRRQQQRLRYWQERLLSEFTERFPEHRGLTVSEIVAALMICHIHERPLSRDRIPAEYGYWVLPEEFMQAHRKQFPYGLMIFYGDSGDVERPPTREVLACPDCRAELERWNRGREQPLGVPPAWSVRFTKQQLEYLRNVPLDDIPNWRLILCQLDDGPIPDFYIERCKEELRRRGLSDSEIGEMQRIVDQIVWPYIETLPYPELWPDESVVEPAIQRFFGEGLIGEEQRDTLLSFYQIRRNQGHS
jgi:hypothetical protein